MKFPVFDSEFSLNAIFYMSLKVVLFRFIMLFNTE